MHKKLELFRKSTHTTMLNPNLSSENCGKKIQSDRPKKWSKITILSPITFWENSRSWSWSDLRSLFEQVILMWSQIAKKVIGQYFDCVTWVCAWGKISYITITYIQGRQTRRCMGNYWLYILHSIWSLFDNCLTCKMVIFCANSSSKTLHT